MILTSSELAYLLLRRTPSVYSLTSQPFSARNCRQGTFLNFSAFFTLKFLTFFFRFFFLVFSLFRCMYDVLSLSITAIPRAQHSTAQSPLHRAANHVRVDQSTYQKKYVRTCMLRPVCFPGARSSWHLQVACLHLTYWTTYLLHLPFIPIHSSL